MPRPRLTIPAYRKHSKTGRAVVSIYRVDGSRTEVILPGDYGSEESKQEYERLLAQLRANDGKAPASSASTELTIAELVERFMGEYVEVHYRRPDGTPRQGSRSRSSRSLWMWSRRRWQCCPKSTATSSRRNCTPALELARF